MPVGGNRFTIMLGRSMFWSMGWQIKGEFPNRSKMIVAVAPHTSNMDFVLAIAIILGLGLRASFLVKHSLFKFPLGPIMTALGGIPVDRTSPQDLVSQMVEQFDKNPKLVLGITPAGTRSRVNEWKRGFARIAQAANVPILPAILDFQSKVVHFEELIADVRDVDHVMAVMQKLTKTGVPKHPRNE